VDILIPFAGDHDGITGSLAAKTPPYTSQFCVEWNDFGTLQKSDFWTSRTGQNRMKNEFPYRTG
jgi:hypothetical protein